MKGSKKEEIHLDLLFEKQLKQFLERLGKYNEFVNKMIKCERCSEALTLDNLGYIAFKDGEAKFFCANPDCMRES